MKKPKILVLDIETSPIITYTWGLFDQNIGLNQIKEDWHLLSFSAKWLGEKKVYYKDQRHSKDIRDDKKLCEAVWKLIDEADVLLTQNGTSFDVKKLNARFVLNGLKPTSSFKHIDTLRLAKKHFGFTSNKLAYMTDKLCTKYKKQEHRKFPGFELWKACLAGNKEAWNEMERYNKYDILSLEELYYKISPWEDINFNHYHDRNEYVCKCGSDDFVLNGFKYLKTGKYQRYRCVDCGAESRDRVNLLSKEKRQSLRS